jgi:Cd2+/Zn2+-exporting ATPase
LERHVDHLTDLIQIGFTEYEAKVYLALLQESPTTGYQISKRSGVPRSMVYEALSRLHARGAVLETIEERATLYRPLPPDLLLDRHADEHQRVIGGLRDGLGRLFNAPEESSVWTITGRGAVITYACQLIRRAETEIFLLANDADLADLHDEIVTTCARGVHVGAVLTGSSVLNCGQVVHHPPLESQLQHIDNALIVVTDNREALVASTGKEMIATTSRHANIVMIARQFIWMELFTQRVYSRLGPELLRQLDPEDQAIFESHQRT